MSSFSFAIAFVASVPFLFTRIRAHLAARVRVAAPQSSASGTDPASGLKAIATSFHLIPICSLFLYIGIPAASHHPIPLLSAFFPPSHAPHNAHIWDGTGLVVQKGEAVSMAIVANLSADLLCSRYWWKIQSEHMFTGYPSPFAHKFARVARTSLTWGKCDTVFTAVCPFVQSTTSCESPHRHNCISSLACGCQLIKL